MIWRSFVLVRMYDLFYLRNPLASEAVEEPSRRDAARRVLRLLESSPVPCRCAAAALRWELPESFCNQDKCFVKQQLLKKKSHIINMSACARKSEEKSW